MNDPGPVAALVVAAGSGVRMGGGHLPKALRPLAGEPLLVHAIRRLALGGASQAVVVIRPGDEPAVGAALSAVDALLDIHVVHGGAERQDSVRLGLDALAALPTPPSVVLVHDAARPLVDPATITRVADAVRSGAPAVVPTVEVVDSIRQRSASGGSVGLDRSTLLAVQTPQGFEFATLVRAHAHVVEHRLAVTDDAGACEAAGVTVTTVAGSATGLKITHPYDLVLAEAMLAGEEERR